MGVYLSMLRNEKPNPAKNIRPDENYAREVMQLFTIGLVQLNQDGSVASDGAGSSIATYTQDDIEGLAHVLTGWNYHGRTPELKVELWRTVAKNFLQPMEAWPEYHDVAEKVIINGIILPAGQPPEEDLKQALDALFYHSNVGPFLGKQLIQRLVTSNPTREYVSRVAGVFADNGSGVRGDLKATIKAILMDPEARDGHLQSPLLFGKLKEPILRQAGLWRGLNAKARSQRYIFNSARTKFGQAPLSSDSVFNFYRPDHQQPGQLSDLGLMTPEFEIADASMLASSTNQYYISVFHRHSEKNNRHNDIVIDISKVVDMADQPQALVDFFNFLLAAGALDTTAQAIIAEHVLAININLADEDSRHNALVRRVQEALYLVMSSPQQAVQQ